ncbi:hypothetical protein PoB_002700500 [Plakobranchus ocellatus]|uniref:Uncharacterized protein n=1 Tax=Plakobranchus ocellatus TaxID=259542 RepID=A0AAV3ZZ82_9GAST|nr:hypothetical protein PoB_002700500 [Plakobranchus ocellatus]
MAARESEQFSRKRKTLDVLEEDYLTNVKKYISAVKAAIRDEPPTQAEEIYHSAITFLIQEIPNPKSLAITPLQSTPTTSKSTPMTSPPTILPITPVLSITNPSPSSSAETSPIGSPIPRPLEEVRQETTFISTLTTEMVVLPGGQAAAAAAAAVTLPPTAPSASALSSPLEILRQRQTFPAKTIADQKETWIQDVKLLPGGRLVLADVVNSCVKLFDTQGQHLHTLECRSGPRRLAVLDSSSIRHTVVVTVPLCQVLVLEVAEDNMTIKRTLQTSRAYVAVAAINDKTLAVGYSEPRNRGIHLIDLGGQVLRQICSSVDPLYMDITEDGDLVCSTRDKTIARVQVDTGAVVFDKSGLPSL